jgi:hypothetical protein
MQAVDVAKSESLAMIEQVYGKVERKTYIPELSGGVGRECKKQPRFEELDFLSDVEGPWEFSLENAFGPLDFSFTERPDFMEPLPKKKTQESHIVKIVEDNFVTSIGDCTAVGMCYNGRYSFSKNELVSFEREPDNSKDPRAIAVMVNGRRVAYVSKNTYDILQRRNLSRLRGRIYKTGCGFADFKVYVLKK